MASFELRDEDGTLRMSSDYPTFQFVKKENVPSFGDGVVAGGVNLMDDWDLMVLAAHTKEATGQWVRYTYDEASRLALPAAGEPSLILYDATGTNVTFILKYPVLNIVGSYFLGEPAYTQSADFTTTQIPMNGRKYALMRQSTTGPVVYTLHSTYTYHNQKYYNYRVTSYWIEPVFDYTAQVIRFERKSDSYISYGHTSPVVSTDTYLTLSFLLVDVTGL